MKNHGALFNASTIGDQNHETIPISLRSVESNDRTSAISHEGFLDAFYRGEFSCCVRNYFNYDQKDRYSINSISYHLPSFEILRSVESSHRLDLFCKGFDWWAAINIGDTWVASEFGASTLERGRELAKRFCNGLASRNDNDQKIDYEIWAGDDSPLHRFFDEVKWTSIQQNYPRYTRDTIETLTAFSRTKSTNDGRIILFHGPPGTGKTYAIRSLLTHWKSWVTPILVLDPEHLLDSPSYMMTILDRNSPMRTKLLVIEDADDIAEKNYSFKSAGDIHSSRMSRLLNAADGIFGASIDVMFLLSTNAEMKQLDPALTRPGRCLATVEFGPFSKEEASERLGKYGPAKSSLTLAEIYRELGETSMLSSERPSSEDSFGVYL